MGSGGQITIDITADTAQDLDKAVDLCKGLLTTVYRDYDAWWQQHMSGQRSSRDTGGKGKDKGKDKGKGRDAPIGGGYKKTVMMDYFAPSFQVGKKFVGYK